MPVTDQSITDSLIALKSQYEQRLSEVAVQTSHLREQLSHVNALLLAQLVPPQVPPKSAEQGLALEEADAPVERLALAPSIREVPVRNTPKPPSTPRNTNTKAKSTGRTPRELLPQYQGLKRLEAIAQVLQANPEEAVTVDGIVEMLFGALDAEALKAERRKLRTLLYQGEKQGLWHKGDSPSSYQINEVAEAPEAIVESQAAALGKAPAKAKASTAKAKSSKTVKRKRSEAELVALLRQADIQV